MLSGGDTGDRPNKCKQKWCRYIIIMACTGHQQRLIQTFTKDVFINCSLLVYIAGALYTICSVAYLQLVTTCEIMSSHFHKISWTAAFSSSPKCNVRWFDDVLAGRLWIKLPFCFQKYYQNVKLGQILKTSIGCAFGNNSLDIGVGLLNLALRIIIINSCSIRMTVKSFTVRFALDGCEANCSWQ